MLELAAAHDPAAAFADPTFWVNLGLAGVFLFLFAMGKVHPQSTLDKTERLADSAMAKVEQQTALAMEKLEQQTATAMAKLENQNAEAQASLERQIERLIAERNRALAERDEMIEVMQDFTRTASALLQVDPPGRKRRRDNDEGL